MRHSPSQSSKSERLRRTPRQKPQARTLKLQRLRTGRTPKRNSKIFGVRAAIHAQNVRAIEINSGAAIVAGTGQPVR